MHVVGGRKHQPRRVVFWGTPARAELHRIAIRIKDFLLSTDKSIEDAFINLGIHNIHSDDIEDQFENWIERCPFCNCWTKAEEFGDGSYYGCSCNSCGNRSI